MSARLIGGPFDGATAQHGDPGFPSIWLAPDPTGVLRYEPYACEGWPRYDRVGEGRYVHGDLTSDVPLLVLEASHQ